jgi:hypothetical protein
VGYRGRVKDGVVVLDDPTGVPEGVVVEVVVLSDAPPKVPAAPTLARRYAAVVGIVVGLPPDLATCHDLEYHGTTRADE